MENKELLKALSLAHAPSSREDKLYTLIKEKFSVFGEVTIDSMNNIIIHKEGNSRGKVMVMAHADEIFLLVTEILNNGVLKFKGVGVDPKSLVAQEVVIHGTKDILGIVNIGKGINKAVNSNDLIIDTGYNKESLEKIIKIGDFITIKGKFVELLNSNVACKTIDNRGSIVAMYQCAKELQNIQHDLDVYFVCSCQEEVGHRGAKMATYNLNPDIGIAIDTTFDSGELGAKDRENIIGNGPVICHGPNLHHKLNKKITSIGDKYGIPYGIEVEPGNTGTDAWDIQVSRKGVPSMLVSIPIKHMHTPVELVNMNDIKNTGKIIARFIENLKENELEELLCF
ncbi:M20/M25/M40 family metallo-hydrolase [Clostridium botulinum]|uniref:Aminopeptidase n=1 Tax=Clostridium botulinum TaxID=1491 RepID=A0A9Q1UYA4_CLOBO|nr:M20/M25/M40 family metallo-hydrolase [Clostridium botulinum]AEB77166.1 Peptidase family M20/M25/M40 protein [Clostridium botulinum BKT015925]KEI00271.1 aminopeptidase [Clostridium botulinum D str. 16868]KEI00434.1 aminopeptidase [Clostridium botulinum C/D str. Sp77]KLU76866.1 aminopeptidase [Clostridium botulinum V891]KOA72933.1 aminopeptidase [Clostridium botulinum]